MKHDQNFSGSRSKRARFSFWLIAFETRTCMPFTEMDSARISFFAVHTAVFGGNTESAEIVEADIVAVFQFLLDIICHQHPRTRQLRTQGRRTARYVIKHSLFAYRAATHYFGIKTRYFLTFLIQVIVNGDKSVSYAHIIYCFIKNFYYLTDTWHFSTQHTVMMPLKQCRFSVGSISIQCRFCTGYIQKQ